MFILLEIETGNAAFGENRYERDQEIYKILDRAAIPEPDHATILRDTNGNKVGTATLMDCPCETCRDKSPNEPDPSY